MKPLSTQILILTLISQIKIEDATFLEDVLIRGKI